MLTRHVGFVGDAVDVKLSNKHNQLISAPKLSRNHKFNQCVVNQWKFIDFLHFKS